MSLPALLVAAWLAGLAIGGWGAWQAQAWRAGAAEAERLQVAAESERAAQRAADDAAARFEAERQRLAARQRVITREVERVITVEAAPAAAVCLGPDGLRLVAAAVSGSASAAGGTAGPVPAADATR